MSNCQHFGGNFMPTQKPKVQTILNEDTHKDFKALCEKEMRTESQMASFIITKYIEAHKSK